MQSAAVGSWLTESCFCDLGTAFIIAASCGLVPPGKELGTAEFCISVDLGTISHHNPGLAKLLGE